MFNKIKVSYDKRKRATIAEFPFSEMRPSVASASVSSSLKVCWSALDDLSEHERNVVLANLIAKYGTIVQ